MLKNDVFGCQIDTVLIWPGLVDSGSQETFDTVLRLLKKMEFAGKRQYINKLQLVLFSTNGSNSMLRLSTLCTIQTSSLNLQNIKPKNN